jgi:heat shock protein HspQ
MAPVTKDVLFKVGEIVHHLRYDYRGVIVGCDATCEADETWYEFQTQGKSYKPTRQQPWYHVLVDGATHQTYVAQQNLEPGDSTRPIDHPLVDQAFATFLGGRYHKANLN